MLGDFLEFSVSVPSLAEAANELQSLGFQEAITTEIADSPYMPLSMSSATIGLRPNNEDALAISFVRPDLINYLRAYRRIGIKPQFASLADDEFHRAGFEDPNGPQIVLLEARTCTPLHPDNVIVSILGDFVEFCAPTHSLAESTEFWGQLGLHQDAERKSTEGSTHLHGHGLRIGFYEGVRFAPGLSFTCADLDTRVAFLEAKGCSIRRQLPFDTPTRAGATIAGNVPIYLLAGA